MNDLLFGGRQKPVTEVFLPKTVLLWFSTHYTIPIPEAMHLFNSLTKSFGHSALLPVVTVLAVHLVYSV